MFDIFAAAGIGSGIMVANSKFVDRHIKQPLDNLQAATKAKIDAKRAELTGEVDPSQLSAVELAEAGLSATEQADL